jgi:pimeloyl-ACP methyl ester carboxylesterase
LLLHGYLEDHTVFDRVVPALISKYKVIMVDFPGHGKSESPESDYSFDEFAVLLDELFNSLEINEKIHLAGHSMGGYAALAFARLYSMKVRSLSLFHSLVSAASPNGKSQRLREAKLILKGRKDLLVNALTGSNFAPGNELLFKSDYNRLKEIGNRVTDKGALSAINAMIKRGSSQEISEGSDFPKLFIIGGKDQVFQSQLQLSEAGSSRNATIVVLENSGHVGFIEEEELFTREFTGFISGT